MAYSEYKPLKSDKWLLLFPRLDVTFKEGEVPEARSSIAPIRMHWNNFGVQVQNSAWRNNVDLMAEEKPLWQFKEEDYVDNDVKTFLVPHKEFHNFVLPGKRVFYYMQSVIPYLFSIDRKGWGGNLSVLPYRENHSKFTHWDELEARAKANISKFDQPEAATTIEPGYVLFLCQIPHDQTILYHSQISVWDALKRTIEVCAELGKRLVVKGHPVNPASMASLKELTLRFGATWVDDVSMHSLIKRASHCVTVNSGSGIEVILHKKPIYAFGKAEYSELVPNIDFKEWLDMGWKVDEYDYMNFIESYVNSLYDTRKPETFDKLF